MELHQFLVDRKHDVVRRYAPTDKPESLGLDIEAVL
jgi:glutathione peroxidase-family protein